MELTMTGNMVVDAKELCDKLTEIGGEGEATRHIVGFEEARDDFLSVIVQYDTGLANTHQVYAAAAHLNAHLMVEYGPIDSYLKEYIGVGLHPSP